jgi:hypothetical protein
MALRPQQPQHTPISETDFNPNLTFTLSTELDQGVILAKRANFASPTTLLKTHPTIPNPHALTLPLVPRFRLPIGRPKLEIVFIVN